MSTDQSSNISTILSHPHLSISTFTLQISNFKFANLLSNWHNLWMMVSISNISPPMYSILTFKSSNPTDTVLSGIPFGHFINKKLIELYDYMHFLMETSICSEISFWRDCTPRVKSNSPANKIETIPHQTSNWYFKDLQWKTNSKEYWLF